MKPVLWRREKMIVIVLAHTALQILLGQKAVWVGSCLASTDVSVCIKITCVKVFEFQFSSVDFRDTMLPNKKYNQFGELPDDQNEEQNDGNEQEEVCMYLSNIVFL